MKYYFDTEFLEGEQTVYQWGIKTDTLLRISGFVFLSIGFYLLYFYYGTLYPLWFIFSSLIFFGMSLPKTPKTIDLISIGIVSEDNREYYAISKDFNLKEAWNRWQPKGIRVSDTRILNGKEYWIRENVLKPVWEDLRKNQNISDRDLKFTYSSLKKLLDKYGKSNEKIAEEIKSFVGNKRNFWKYILLGDKKPFPDNIILESNEKFYDNKLAWEEGEKYINKYANKENFEIDVMKFSEKSKPEFYAYYADYDWVVFCWLFGRMIDLPKGFPMYCRDLKQILDEKYILQENKYKGISRLEAWLQDVKKHPNYPKNENEHSAIADARWNKKLHEFLNNI